ncbi:hypothetical protein BDY24DRAFT_126595 [Mrakia frigida]|uniref:uncharacterized protein n=1 Tax=Mrakia frigida TaxID=29902 RepID=UPI003FCC1F87
MIDPSPSPFFNDKVREHASILRSFATPTRPDDWASNEQFHKAHIHLLIIHALRHIHDECPKWPDCDYKDALGYCSLLLRMVGDYLTMETQFYWPLLLSKGEHLEPNPFKLPSSLSTSSTKTLSYNFFLPLQGFLSQAQHYHETFNAATFQAHLVRLAEPLAECLCRDVEKLGPERFRVVFDEQGVEELRKKIEVELKEKVDKFQYYPVVLSNIEPDLQDVVLPLSWIQKEVIIPWVLTQKSRGFWDYSRFPQNLGYDGYREHSHKD